MALKRRHTALKNIERQVTNRAYLQMLPVTDPRAFGAALDEIARQQWSDKRGLIPYHTGDLVKILTDKDSPNREIQARSGRVVFRIKHNGMFYRASVNQTVMGLLNMRALIRDAVNLLRQRASQRTGRRVSN